MAVFVDEYAPSNMHGFPVSVISNRSSRIVRVDSGAEQVNQRWTHGLRTFVLPEVKRSQATLNAVVAHWEAMAGPAHTWPYRDISDFTSVNQVYPNTQPAISGTDQAIGTGDAATTTFQLVKAYASGSQTYSRKILLPVVASVLVLIDGVDPAPLTWAVSRPGGVVTFSGPPALNAAITAGFVFDVPVRFEADDSLVSRVPTHNAAGFGEITLVEARSCD